jgi:Retroviral aspartyl protease
LVRASSELSTEFELITAQLWAGCAETAMPIFSINVVRLLFCVALVESRPSQTVVDSGSTLTFLSQYFVERNRLPVFSCVGLLVSVVSGDTFRVFLVCEVEIEILEKKLKGLCGVSNHFPYGILLGLDFLSRTNFILDFNSLQTLIVVVDVLSSLFFVEQFLSVTDTLGSHGPFASRKILPN